MAAPVGAGKLGMSNTLSGGRQFCGFTKATLLYRAVPAVVALCSFFAVSAIYLSDHTDAYRAILYAWGIVPFEFPFVDISGPLAAWDCTRLGIDVIAHNSCDVLGRGYTYSPLWMSGSFIPLGAGATRIVGWVLRSPSLFFP